MKYIPRLNLPISTRFAPSKCCGSSEVGTTSELPLDLLGANGNSSEVLLKNTSQLHSFCSEQMKYPLKL